MSLDHWHLLKQTSRTFFLSIRRLPGMLSESMCLAYLLLRVSDYLEDNLLMTPGEKVELLTLWEKILANQESPEILINRLDRAGVADEPDGYLSQQAGELINLVNNLPEKYRSVILPHVRASTLGMARWTSRGPDIRTEDDLDDYMYEVAGRVGYLSTEIFAVYSPSIYSRLDSLMPLARDTGLALQTVNILRGLRKDYERGWIFIPQNFCNDAGICPVELFNPDYLPAAMQVINRVAEKAAHHLNAALSYVLFLPPWMHSIRLACIWPMLFAAKTLTISRQNVNILLNEVKITRPEVTKIIRDTSLMGWSNNWLRGYFNRLMTTP